MSARFPIVGAFACIVAIAVVFVASAHRVVVTHSAPASTDT
jgi:putative flippase GtrA